MKKQMVIEEVLPHTEESERHYLLNTLSLELRKQVEECWVDPTDFRIGHLLGNGKMFSTLCQNQFAMTFQAEANLLSGDILSWVHCLWKYLGFVSHCETHL